MNNIKRQLEICLVVILNLTHGYCHNINNQLSTLIKAMKAFTKRRSELVKVAWIPNEYLLIVIGGQYD